MEEAAGVDGIVDKWEMVRAAPEPIFGGPDFVRNAGSTQFAAVDPARRRKWFRAVHRSNLVIFAYSEAFSDKVLERLMSLRDPP